MALDLNFYFDPVCPFAWITSKWVRMVALRRDYSVDWRFISLRLINADVDYATHFPAGYEDGHTAGLRLLRVAARVRAEYGNPTVGALYSAIGTRLFDTPRTEHLTPPTRPRGTSSNRCWSRSGCPPSSPTPSTTGYDPQIQAETDEALALTGRDVGTPILHFQPPEGVAFFGPVISRLPKPEDAINRCARPFRLRATSRETTTAHSGRIGLHATKTRRLRRRGTVVRTTRGRPAQAG